MTEQHPPRHDERYPMAEQAQQPPIPPGQWYSGNANVPTDRPSVTPFDPPKKQRPWVPWVAAIAVAFVCGVVAGSFDSDDGATVAAADDSPAPTVTVTQTAAPAAAKPTPAPKPPAPTVKPTPKPKPAPVTYRKVSAREWKLIAKAPDNYINQKLIVYGTVTQFDAATGTEGFRGNVDGVRRAETYDYETNTVLQGDPTMLEKIVEDDEFMAKVTVTGSYSYETQIGGETTAPQLQVDSITVLD